ncbi:MAG: hypothetical protein U9N81_14070 [Bacillota bacterium]|nr:hypothetical protein [Bacillota bacterium]
MLILLKLVGFSIWFIVMFFMLLGPRRHLEPYMETALPLSNPDHAEKMIRDQLCRMHPCARLTILMPYGNSKTSQELGQIIRCFMRKNPAVNVGFFQPLTLPDKI